MKTKLNRYLNEDNGKCAALPMVDGLKTYLSQSERKDMIYYTSFLGFLDNKFIQGWCKRDSVLTKDEKKYARTAVSLLDKVMLGLFDRLGTDFVKRLVSDIKDSDIFIMPKLTAKEKKAEFLKEDGIIVCQLDDIYGLAEIALLKCNNCVGSNYTSCKLRGYLMDINIPVYNEFANNKCQYLPDGRVKYTI